MVKTVLPATGLLAGLLVNEPLAPEWRTAIDVLFVVILFLAAWIIKRLWSELDQLKKCVMGLREDIKKLSLTVAGEYASKSDLEKFEKRLDRQLYDIKGRTDILMKVIDKKADKKT